MDQSAVRVRLPAVERHVHDAAAHLNFVLIEVAGQIDLHDPRGSGLRCGRLVQNRIRAAEHLALAAPAADGAERLAIGRHDHLGADLARHRAARPNDRRQHERLSVRKNLFGAFPQVFHAANPIRTPGAHATRTRSRVPVPSWFSASCLPVHVVLVSTLVILANTRLLSANGKPERAFYLPPLPSPLPPGEREFRREPVRPFGNIHTAPHVPFFSAVNYPARPCRRVF